MSELVLENTNPENAVPVNIPVNAPLPGFKPQISGQDRQAMINIAHSEFTGEAMHYLGTIGSTPLAEKDQVIFAHGSQGFPANGHSARVYDGLMLHFEIPFRAVTVEQRDLYDRLLYVSPQLINDGWIKRISGAANIAAWTQEREIKLAERRMEIKMGKVLNSMNSRGSQKKFMTSAMKPSDQ